MKITKEDLATKLNGREYPFKITNDEIEAAKESNLIIAYGESDDLLELQGAINEEFGAYGGVTVRLKDDGTLLKNYCDDDNCPYFVERLVKAKYYIRAIWHDEGECAWIIESNLPYAPFDIVEDGGKYCRGIVIEMPGKSEEK